MAIEFRCPQCQKLLRTPDNTAGKQAKCPECASVMTIPPPGETPRAVAAPGPIAGAPGVGSPPPPGAALGSPFGQAQGVPFQPSLPVQQETGNPYQSPAYYDLAGIQAYQWFYLVQGQQRGPVATPVLIGQINSGAMAATVPVWRAGMPQWLPAHLVPELQAAGLGGVSGAAAHQLTLFPVPLLILLHFVSLGLFTTIWLNLMHGQMPKRRYDDPSAAKAIGFLFIPFFNLYWVFFTYCRLCDRINEQRCGLRLLPNAPKGLAITMCVLMLLPYLGAISFLILVPVFAGIIQSSVNDLVAATYRGQLMPAPSYDGKAVGSLTMGFVALITCFCPVVGFITSGIGLVLGLTSLNTVSRGMAIAGVCLSGVSLLLTILVHVAMVMA